MYRAGLKKEDTQSSNTVKGEDQDTSNLLSNETIKADVVKVEGATSKAMVQNQIIPIDLDVEELTSQACFNLVANQCDQMSDGSDLSPE